MFSFLKDMRYRIILKTYWILNTAFNLASKNLAGTDSVHCDNTILLYKVENIQFITLLYGIVTVHRLFVSEVMSFKF